MRNLFSDYKLFNIDPARLRSPGFFRNMLEYRDIVMGQFGSAIKKRNQFQCLLCASRKGKDFLRYKTYLLVECSGCGLVSPNIDFAKIGGHEVYDDPACVKDTTREVLDTYEYRKKTYAPERLNYIMEKTGLTPRSIRLLDVGCGPGYFLSHLADRKIRSKGLELAQFLVAICKKKKLNVTRTDVADEPDATYNVVTLFDVLEHLPDPIRFLKTVKKKLVPGGYVLAYVPNIHSVAYHLMAEYQNTLAPFQHYSFFDPKSLTYLARKTGLKIHSVDYYGLDLMDYFYMKEDQEPIGYHRRLADLIPILQAIIDKQKLSNHMRVMFKK